MPAVEFVDCTSLSISIDIYGLATINYTMIANDGNLHFTNSIAGYTGYVAEVSNQPLVLAGSKWWMNNISLIATN